MTTFYEVKDTDGRLVAIHSRQDGPDGKSMKWLRPDGKLGLDGLGSADLPLYGSERLAGWDVDATRVVVTEGEKAADALLAVGIPAVGTVCGAAVTPSAATLAALAGRHVVLWPDNDDAGRQHMTLIAARLAGVAASVSRVSWPDAPPKGDAADYGGNPWDLIDAAEPYVAAKPTWRTLADVSDDPPGPLLFGMLEPAGPTLAYGAPGVGKGMTGAWLICQAQEAGMLPLVYDAERRPHEWARRVSGLGGDRSHVAYLEPEDLGPKLAGSPLWESAPTIGQVAKTAGADLLIVDSIMPASGVGEERLRSDAQVPYLWVAALDALRIPSLSFGHPPKGTPEGEPFGSFAWVAAMRLTWLGTRAEGDEHRIRWRPRKRNERGRIPGILLTLAYDGDGRPCSAVRADDDESTRDWILAALVAGPLGVSEMAEQMLEEYDDPAGGELERIRDRIAGALYRMARQGWVEKRGKKGPGVVWALRVRP